MKRSSKLLGCLVFISAFSFSSFATKISKIEYIGSKRIEKETIETYLPLQVGDECNEDMINESLKALYETGFFEDVSIELQGSVLKVKLREYPTINKVSFEGNSKLSDRDIKKAIKLDVRETLSPTKIKEIQQGLLEQYRKIGRYSATVNPKVIKLPDNRVNLVFEIYEGVDAGIGRIVFIGNDQISSSELRDAILSKVKRWYRFFANDDVYDPDRLEEDKRAILRYYQEQGYASARVISGIAELSPDKKEFVLTFTIEEGKPYTFGNISVRSQVNKISAKDYENGLYCVKGEKFDQSLLALDAATIARKIGKSGSASIRVTPQVDKHPESQIVDVTFNITEGEKVYISKIVINGNTKTRDSVIRREILLEEGDAYNQALVDQAEGNLRNLGFFQRVGIDVLPDPVAPDKCILQVTVEETPTAEAMIAASYATVSGFGIELTYNEANFFGTGKALSVLVGSGQSVSGASRESDGEGGTKKIEKRDKFRFFNNVQLSLSDPHIFDKDMEGSISGYRFVTSKFDGFDIKELGTDLGLSYNLSQHFYQGWEYSVAARSFADISRYSSPIIRSQACKDPRTLKAARCNSSALTHTIGYSTNFVKGLKGRINMYLTTNVAGLGGQARHIKNELMGTYSMPLFRRTNMRLSLSTGLLSKLGNKQPHIIDSFILGMDSFRGFEYAGFGPFSSTVREELSSDSKKIRNVSRRDFIGAKKYWKGSAEYSFPVGLPEELQFRGFVFTDLGTLWDAPCKGGSFLKKTGTIVKDENGEEHEAVVCDFDKTIKAHKILDGKKLRVSTGLGISFVTPFGPIKLSYAIPVKKQRYDEQCRFLVSFDTRF